MFLLIVPMLLLLLWASLFHPVQELRVCSPCNVYMTGIGKNMSQLQKKYYYPSAAGTVALT